VDRLLDEAERHRAAGRREPAAQRFNTVLSSRRHDPRALRGLAQIAYERMDLDESLRLLREAVRHHPMRSELHGDLARTLQVRGLHEEALAAYQRSVAIDPSFAASWCGIGEIHERLGRFGDARDAFARALEIEPSRDVIRFYLARLVARTGDHERAVRDLRELVDRGVDPALEARCRAQIGRSLDRLGRYLDGFDEVARAKRLMLEGVTNLEAVRVESRRQREAEAAQMRAATSALMARWGADPVAQEREVAFLVGFPRSGTTLTERVLDAHPGVITTDETMAVSQLEQQIRAFPSRGATPVEKLAGAPNRIVRDLQRSYFDRVETILGRRIGQRLLVDKMPLNILRVPLLARTFPRARIILALRDPRDVVASCFMRLGEGGDVQTVDFLSLGGCVDRYCRVMDAWCEFETRCPLPVIRLRYEDTVEDLEGQARRLIEFLGLPWRDEVLSFHEAAGTRYIKAPTYEDVGRRVHKDAVARWRRYEARLDPAHLARLEPFLEAFGYGL
jgi:Flp pilus assembly protein TadD